MFGGVVSKMKVEDHTRVATAEDYVVAKAIADHADSDSDKESGEHQNDVA